MNVLLTRPKSRVEPLIEKLSKINVQSTPMALFEMVEHEFSGENRQTVMSLDEYQKVIVTSPIAASFFLDKVDQFWPQVPHGIEFFVNGPGSFEQFLPFDVEPKFPDSGFTSEDLLPIINTNKEEKILLVKGDGGRGLIKQTLSPQCAKFDELCLYKREEISYTQQQISTLLQGVDWLQCSSVDNLKQLHKLLGLEQRSQLRIMVSSERLAIQCNGFKEVAIADGATDDALVEAFAHLTNQ